MSSSFRRYEILLPKQYNDGKEVPESLIGKSVMELRTKFGAASIETQIIEGTWQHRGSVYMDRTRRLFVDVPDLADNRRYFTGYKETLKARYRQIDVWVATWPIEIL